MNRRHFLKTSLTVSAVGGLGATTSALAAAGDKSPQELYELRAYRLKPDSDGALLHRFLEKAAIPALNRIGCSPVGVFTETEPKDGPAVHVLIPHASMEAFTQSTAKINADKEYLSAGAEYLEVAKNSPAFVRIDTWLHLAFAGMPKLRQPEYSKAKTARIFELRTYESHSEAKAVKKVEMFNNGEIEIMQDVGLGPIFFGQALAGPNLPHLAYMLSAEDRDAHKKHFGAFGAHPAWKKLSADPQYKDTVSKISSRFLNPTAYSQI
jgi:hypothetical protein